MIRGLTSGGVFSGGKIKVSFFVDPALYAKERLVYQFIKQLDEMSQNLGVPFLISSKPKQVRKYVNEDFFTSNQLSLTLKSLGKHFEGTIVVIGTQQNIDHAYTIVKREFGGKLDLTTQFVEFNETLLRKNDRKIRYHLYNILLGIYAKSGVQPWILKKHLNSDCFIGLDVSHINGKHASGIVQVIGKDGRLIRQMTTSTHESGEKISSESLKEVVEDSLYAYHNVYQEYPKHITFHRDGKCREDLQQLKQILSPLNVKFDYVEIIKYPNRRMATFHPNHGWYTEQGLYYKRYQTAYLCATNPNAGMAQPIKICQKTDQLTLEQIIQDIYDLSFMHIHSLLKTRLPITTHYADISSHFHNKGLLHPRSEHVESLPFV